MRGKIKPKSKKTSNALDGGRSTQKLAYMRSEQRIGDKLSVLIYAIIKKNNNTLSVDYCWHDKMCVCVRMNMLSLSFHDLVLSTNFARFLYPSFPFTVPWFIYILYIEILLMIKF